MFKILHCLFFLDLCILDIWISLSSIYTVVTNYGCFARCPVRPESFCPSRESFHPQYEVVLRGLRVHSYTYVCGPAPFFRTRNIHTTFLPVNLCRTHRKINQKKILNLTCFSLFLDPVVTCTYHVVWEFIWETRITSWILPGPLLPKKPKAYTSMRKVINTSTSLSRDMKISQMFFREKTSKY